MNTVSVMGVENFDDIPPGGRLIESKQIHDLFLDIGIPPHLRGYRYLAYAMELIGSDSSYMQHLTTRLYIDVAEHFETSSACVGRAMKRAIANAWAYGNISFIHYIFKNCVNPNKGVPTNALFLSRMYYYLLSIKSK